jgi:uncharacterized protein YeaO (DUF488 family)
MLILRIKRVYETPDDTDGMRILVERLWPRGLTKEEAKIDFWCKDIAPSNGLRTWFGHRVGKWNGFKDRYLAEISENPEAVDLLLQRMGTGVVTFVYAASDIEHNSAVVLKQVLEKMRR